MTVTTGMMRRHFLYAGLAVLAGCRNRTPAFLNTDLTGTTIGEAFTLDDHLGRTRSLDEFHGKLVILFFGYTSCPDVCPTALAKFSGLLQQSSLGPDRLQVIFVTLDPERDTPQRLSDYVPWFHPSFIGLRGDSQKIAEIANKFRVTYVRRDLTGSGVGYVLDHSAGAYVFGPDGRIRLHLAEGARVEDIAADLLRLLAGE